MYNGILHTVINKSFSLEILLILPRGLLSVKVLLMWVRPKPTRRRFAAVMDLDLDYGAAYRRPHQTMDLLATPSGSSGLPIVMKFSPCSTITSPSVPAGASI